ncbi:hypothetical protein HUW46_09394 [Amycolatopsis sp. CA-230715]|nr:hypothetical protein HUW46_09394 [Amycolatopsis sp. CA-230715]
MPDDKEQEERSMSWAAGKAPRKENDSKGSDNDSSAHRE